MKSIDLTAEMETACAAVKQIHLDRLRSLGVSSQTIARIGDQQAPFGISKVDHIGQAIYQPGGERQSIVTPVYDGCDLIDLISWQTSFPARWLWRCGAAWALGIDSIASNNWTDDPLQIFATPLDWLRGGADGLVILDWDAPEIRQLLRVKAIQSDLAIAAQLRSALMKPAYFPKIITREGLRNAA